MISVNRSTLTRVLILAGIFLPVIALSQVTIKEKIEVTPKAQYSLSKTLNGDSTFTVRVDWDINYPSPGQVRFVASANYELVEEGPQHQIFTVDYYCTGLYVLYVSHYGWPDSLHGTVKVQKVNSPEYTYPFALGSYSGSGDAPTASFHLGDYWGNNPFTTPFAYWLNLSVGKENIFPWETNYFRLTERIDTVTSVHWYSAIDSVTLSVVAGAELGGLVGPSNVGPTSSLKLLAGEISSVSFVVSDSGASGGTVTVEARSKGIIDTKTFQVQPFVGKRLKLQTLSPVAFGQSGYFQAQILDSTDADVPIPEGMTFSYRILEGSSWAFLSDDYYGVSGPVLENVTSIVGLGTLDTARYDDKKVRVCVSASDARLIADTAETMILPGRLKLRVTPSASIKYGDSVLIEAEGIYAGNVLRPVYPGITYTYEIVESPNAGYLTAEGDTTHLDVIPDIGPAVTFTAKEENPQADSVRVVVLVTATEVVEEGRVDVVDGNPPKSRRAFGLLKQGNAKVQGTIQNIGVARVVLQRPKLRIVDHSPWTIWPLLPPQRRGQSRGADRPGYVYRRSFRVEVKDPAGRPASQVEVKLVTDFEGRSGGHQHLFGMPSLPVEKQGSFYGQGKQNKNPIFLTTDEQGVAVADSLVASQVAGKFLVTASLVADTTVKDTVHLEIKVPGLVNFRDLIVLEEVPFSFLQSDTGTANHPDNNWCTADMGNNLYLTVLDFYEWTRAQGMPVRTSLNDMSLEWGGYFDISANWDLEHPSHSFHRVGLSIDINRGLMTADQVDQLTAFADIHGGVRNERESQIHYGFNGGN